MDVFPAGETPIPGISGKTIVSEVLQNGTLKDVTYIASRRELVNTLCDECREGDLVITQGAGDITLMGPAFIQALRERATEE
jgi:UDP-N-acetylmuramate--alanine ligase